MNKLINFFETKKALPLLLVLFLTTLVYSNILSNGFVWDDPDFYQNWPTLYRWDNALNLLGGEVPLIHKGVYRPLRGLIQLILFQIIGPKNFIAYHLVSLLIHLVSVIALYFLIEQIAKNRLIAFLTTLIFGLHPIHTEAISYLTTSVDVIGVTFMFWAFYFYLFWRQRHQNWQFISAVVLGLLAFFTYEMTLVLPLLILLVEWYFAEFNWAKTIKQIKNLWPYWLGIAAYIVLRLSLNTGQRFLTPDPNQSNWHIRILTMGKATLKYIYLLFIPYPLNIFHKINLSSNLFQPKIFLSWLTIFILIGILIFSAKKLKLASVAGLWFFIALMPVSNIFPTGIIMAEKYMYLSSVSSALLLALLIYYLIKRGKIFFQAGAIILTLAIALVYGGLTYARNFDWKSDLAIWQATTELRPDYGRVWSNLGFSYYKEKNYEKALENFLKARALEPELPLIYHNLGNVYDEMGDYDLAIENYLKAVKTREGIEFYNRTETYNNLAIIYQKLDNLAEAKKYFQKAIDFDPTYFKAYSNLGVVALLEKDYATAQDLFQKTIGLSDNFAPAHHGLAVSLVNQNQIKQAIPHYEKSMALDPQLTDNYNHLAFIYNQSGETQKALDILQAGAAANPNDIELRTNYGILLANNGQYQQAIVELQAALAIDPNYEAAKKVLEQITKK